ncbi:MAG TPA: hypothetical protein VF544_16090 [Pyrinomonadaceae bacterium]|jgi:hypothetical protein
MNTPAQETTGANNPVQVRQRQPIELDHAKSFLDIVLGVIISLPLPGLVRMTFNLVAVLYRRPLDQTALYHTMTPFLLTTSALVMITFYWLEVRQSIDRQVSFNKKLATTEGTPGEGVHLGRSRLLGAILMITTLAAILEFARSYEFRPFLLASLLFWILDMLGDWQLRKSYDGYRETIDKIQTEITTPVPQPKRPILIWLGWIEAASQEQLERRGEYQWFIDHLGTDFYSLYSGGYAILFAILLYLDCLLDYDNKGAARLEIYRLAAALFVLLMTLVGHLYIRVNVFENYVKRRLGASSG